MKKWLTQEKQRVAFSLYPVSVNDLMDIADAGEVMPPKSTWFEPKLRDGFISTFNLTLRFSVPLW
ncbi:MAG: hypothetical protein MZV64_15155 [Ignavibacteriales bacterium]|nr:hypothetical protein [Ignavibacteriales bacterium]